MREFLRLWFLLWAVWIVGCSSWQTDTTSTSSSSSSASSSGTGGGDGGQTGPCPVDCSTLKTTQCQVAKCNTDPSAGPLHACIVVPAPDGTTCDDGLFCTTKDTCSKGQCVGGPPNDCSVKAGPCQSVTCDETSKTCSVAPQADGSACTPTDLCQVDGTCKAGVCNGQPKDCTFSPLNECNKVACDSSTGKCTGTPDSTKDGTICVLTGDLCSLDKTCKSGQCAGGVPKDCSGLTSECQVGKCDGTTGLCGTVPAAMGTACDQGVGTCQVGACDTMGKCMASTAPNGTACNDHDSCTQGDSCTAGACAGMAVTGCKLYLDEGFETCPDGWTLGGDWQCGAPMNVGPAKAHSGNNCIATQIAGNYHNGQSFSTCTADSPSIDLTGATNPMLSFWAWVWTEGSFADGWNLSVSTNGGQSYQEVTTVTPKYSLTILSQPSWGGNLSAQGWQNYTADLTAYAGQSIKLRFAFRSDLATTFPGVYIDDVLVAEPVQVPLYITTPSPLPDVYAGQDYSVPIAATGGSGNLVWSIVGGTNKDWLLINSSTGVLYGTPAPANVGPVSVTVHVEEKTLPSNFAEQTYTFKVKPDVYYTSWSGTCPDGWTLTGDWTCGVPTNPDPTAPTKCYAGTQCIGTGMSQDYNNLDTWAATTATSPEIDLSGVAFPTLTFRMWVDTEGFTFDGGNLEVSTDGGMTYSVLGTVTPPYPLMIAGEACWGGRQSMLGWQLVQADLTAYSGMKIYLRFGFQSDFSNTYSGVYIDDFLVE